MVSYLLKKKENPTRKKVSKHIKTVKHTQNKRYKFDLCGHIYKYMKWKSNQFQYLHHLVTLKWQTSSTDSWPDHDSFMESNIHMGYHLSFFLLLPHFCFDLFWLLMMCCLNECPVLPNGFENQCFQATDLIASHYLLELPFC